MIALHGFEPHVALILLVLLFVAFLTERYPPDVVAAAGAAVFILLGFVSFDEAMAVFSNAAPITIAAMFIISGAMVRTGLMDALADLVVRRAESHPRLAIAIFLGATILASAFVNNTPVVVVLIPVVVRLAQTLHLAPTQLLIPLSYAAILGGTCTLIGTSTNLLVDGIARESGMEGFTIFEISGVGLIVAVTGIVMMLLTGARLLPHREAASTADAAQDLTYMTDIAVSPGFAGIGTPLGKIAAFNRPGVRITGLRRQGETIRTGFETMELQARDTLLLHASTSELLTLAADEGLVTGIKRGSDPADEEVILAEAILTPRSTVPRPRIADLSIGPQGGIRVLGVHRHKHAAGPDLASARLRMGDRLLLRAGPSNLDHLSEAGDLLSITRPSVRAFRRTKAPLTLLALAAVVGLAALNVAPIGILALVAVAGLLVLRCIDSDEAWGSVDGGILVLIFSMLIVGRGLEDTGAVTLLVDAMTPTLQHLPPFLLLLAIYFSASVLTELVTNNAVAVVYTPIVIATASTLGYDPRGLVVAIMFAASASFATPIGYQTNTLVYRTGAYTFADFLRIGVPMNIVVGFATCVAIYHLFPI